MITAIFTLSQVRGAELWLLFWCISLVAYIGIGYRLKSNHIKQGIKNLSIGLLIAEVANDLWFVFMGCPFGYHFDNRNHKEQKSWEVSQVPVCSRQFLD